MVITEAPKPRSKTAAPGHTDRRELTMKVPRKLRGWRVVKGTRRGNGQCCPSLPLPVLCPYSVKKGVRSFLRPTEQGFWRAIWRMWLWALVFSGFRG